MNLPEHLVDLLEETFVSGMRLHSESADRFRERFREDPERFLVSFILSAKKDSQPKAFIGTQFTLYSAAGDKSLQEARKLIEEWEKESVANH